MTVVEFLVLTFGAAVWDDELGDYRYAEVSS